MRASLRRVYSTPGLFGTAELFEFLLDIADGFLLGFDLHLFVDLILQVLFDVLLCLGDLFSCLFDSAVEIIVFTEQFLEVFFQFAQELLLFFEFFFDD